MNNRIDKLFARKPENILSLYFTAGYPNLDDTATIIQSLQQNGADMAEIGIPFSDPMADGPVIQASNHKALINGMTLAYLFEQLRNIRQHVDMPLVMMGYINPIMQYGFDRFCRHAAECGIDGIIIPDLPFAEYMDSYRNVATQNGLHIIMLITPETSAERIHQIDQNTGGFIYMVSTASVTGARNEFDERSTAYFRRIGQMNLRNPRLIGFGISNQNTFRTACQYASGAIIGSRFVTLLGSEPNADAAVKSLRRDVLGT